MPDQSIVVFSAEKEKSFFEQLDFLPNFPTAYASKIHPIPQYYSLSLSFLEDQVKLEMPAPDLFSTVMDITLPFKKPRISKKQFGATNYLGIESLVAWDY